VEDRTAYLGALDRASIDMKIEPLAEFIAERCAGRRSSRLRKHEREVEVFEGNPPWGDTLKTIAFVTLRCRWNIESHYGEGATPQLPIG
jgi:hypothetical protein